MSQNNKYVWAKASVRPDRTKSFEEDSHFLFAVFEGASWDDEILGTDLAAISANMVEFCRYINILSHKKSI
jgi:hypothetical protein